MNIIGNKLENWKTYKMFILLIKEGRIIMKNYLVDKCKRSNAFAWGLTFTGIALIIIIAFL